MLQLSLLAVVSVAGVTCEVSDDLNGVTILSFSEELVFSLFAGVETLPVTCHGLFANATQL